jgi:hypothetical protein
MKSVCIGIAILNLAIVSACRKSKSATDGLVNGKWAIWRQHIENLTSNGTAIDSSSYETDSFAVTFDGSGKYILTYPAGIVVNSDSIDNIWRVEDGTYASTSDMLSVTTARNSILWHIFYGAGDTASSEVHLQSLGPDSLIAIAGWGKIGNIPYYYDSTLLIRLH